MPKEILLRHEGAAKMTRRISVNRFRTFKRGTLMTTTPTTPATQTATDETFIESIQATPMATAANYYADCLSESPKAVAFILDQFSMTLKQAAEFQIGFSDRTLGKRLPSKDMREGRDVRKFLKEAGLYKKNGPEALRGCVTVPLYDGAGNITGILGKRIERPKDGQWETTIGVGSPRAPLGGSTQAPPCNDSELAEAVAEKLPANNANNANKKVNTPKPIDDSLVVEDEQVVFTRDDRRYRIRGLEKNTSPCTLKVNVMASRDELVHLDMLDFVKARSRASFIKATAAELFTDADTIKKDIGCLLLKLESLREQQIAEAKATKVKVVELTEGESAAAMTLLQDPNLPQRIVADVAACGMVGEATNTLVGYLAATSRKLKEPLAVVIQSSSSAGKTSLMDAILAMMPDEDQLRFSGMTGQSLFYLNSDEIRHKTLAISEDEGIAEATYALKLLQSEGELRHATVGRDAAGNLSTQTAHVEGPVQIMLTTTAMDIDEELVNRCLVLSVDESRNQTGEILAKQRGARSLDTFLAGEAAKQIRKLHQNAQRLLKPLRVFNPFASQLTFPNHKTRLRRDHQKYLTLIDTVALLHQYQRPIHSANLQGEATDYINVQPSDIAIANGIAGEVLGRSLDELAPQTRRLLMLLKQYVEGEAKTTGVSRHAFRFTRRDVREATQWSDTQLHRHLTRLVDLEYINVHRGKHGRRYVYELLYGGEGHEGQPFLMGLIDPAQLKTPSTTPSLAG